jgi:hypothetical protein
VLPAEHCRTQPAGNPAAHDLLEDPTIGACASHEHGALVAAAQEIPGIRVRHG